MTDKTYLPLSRMEAGQSGRIVEIQGGHGIVNRLNALNVRPGKRITKVNSMLMRGPVTIEVANNRVAIGYGMAKRVIVEI